MRPQATLLLLLAAASAFPQQKHDYQQGQIVETHTEYGDSDSCSSHSYCPKTEATIVLGGHRLHVIGARDGGYYPGRLNNGVVTVDFVKNPDLWIVDGDAKLRFNIKDIE